jgi:hypothetical protein
VSAQGAPHDGLKGRRCVGAVVADGHGAVSEVGLDGGDAGSAAAGDVFGAQLVRPRPPSCSCQSVRRRADR